MADSEKCGSCSNGEHVCEDEEHCSCECAFEARIIAQRDSKPTNGFMIVRAGVLSVYPEDDFYNGSCSKEDSLRIARTIMNGHPGLPIEIETARRVLIQSWIDDPGFKHAYIANAAMVLYDMQREYEKRGSSFDMQDRAVREDAATRILDWLFPPKEVNERRSPTSQKSA